MERLLKSERLHTSALGYQAIYPHDPADNADDEQQDRTGGSSGGGGGAAEKSNEGMFFVTGEDSHSLESWHIKRDLKFVEFIGHVEPVICVVAVRQRQLRGTSSSGGGGGGGGGGRSNQDDDDGFSSRRESATVGV
jgi:hypothetical protein